MERIGAWCLPMDRSPSYVVELARDSTGAANIVGYAEIVRERAQLRFAIERGRALTAAAMKPGAESSRVIADAVHDLSAAQAARQRGGLEPAKVAAKAFYEELNRRYTAGPG